MSFYGGIDRGELRFFEGIDGEGRTYWSGCAWQLGTARFWEVLAEDTCNAGSYRLGATLREELAACIVGGFGATWNLPVAFSGDFQGVPIEAPRETSKTVRIRSIGKDWKDWTGRTGRS